MRTDQDLRRDCMAYSALGAVEAWAEMLSEKSASPEWIAARIVKRAAEFKAQQQAEALQSV